MFWQRTEIVVDIFGGDFEGFVQCFAFGKLGESGGGSDGGGAAVGLPTNVDDFVVFDFDVHFHLVTTDRVAD